MVALIDLKIQLSPKQEQKKWRAYLISEDVIKLLSGLCGKTNQEFVEGAGLVHQLRVEEGLGQGDSHGYLSVIVHLLNQARIDR